MSPRDPDPAGREGVVVELRRVAAEGSPGRGAACAGRPPGGGGAEGRPVGWAGGPRQKCRWPASPVPTTNNGAVLTGRSGAESFILQGDE